MKKVVLYIPIAPYILIDSRHRSFNNFIAKGNTTQMHWEQSLPIVSSKRNPPLNLNLSMTGNYICSNTYIKLTLIKFNLGYT